MLSHHYLFAVNDVQAFLQVLYVCIALDESAVGAVGIGLSVVRLDVSNSCFQPFDESKFFPLICLLVSCY